MKLFALFFLQMALILSTCRLVGIVAKNRQPQIVREIIAGVIFGPSPPGQLWSGFIALFFIQESRDIHELGTKLGVVL